MIDVILFVASVFLVILSGILLWKNNKKYDEKLCVCQNLKKELLDLDKELLDLDIAINMASELLSRLRSSIGQYNSTKIPKFLGSNVIDFKKKCQK